MNSYKGLRPRKNYLIFQYLEPKTKSGILMPQNYTDVRLKKGKFLVGLIKKVGPEVKDLKPGYYIIFNQYGIENTLAPSPGQFYIIRETEIIAYFKDKTPAFVLRGDENSEKI